MNIHYTTRTYADLSITFLTLIQIFIMKWKYQQVLSFFSGVASSDYQLELETYLIAHLSIDYFHF